MRRFFRQERNGGYRLHAAFEISGQAGFLYDALVNEVDSVHVVNPTKATRNRIARSLAAAYRLNPEG